MPTQSLQHNTPTFSTRNINSDSTNSLPSPYNSPILASDLMAFPAGGVKNANTLDELRRALNQLAKDKKEYLDGLQVQVTNNDGDITIIDTNLTEIQADLVNVARDLSRKAWESILIHAGTGLSGGGSIAADRTINLNVSSPNEIGGVKSATDTIAETIGTTAENAINGHITVNTTTGYMKVLNNAVELGVKTRGDYIKNITATTTDGITLTNGTGEGAITDLKLTDLHTTTSTFGSISDANAQGYAHGTAQNNKIRRVLVPSIVRDKFGRVITGTGTLQVNSANNNSITVSVGNGLAVAGTDATDANTGVVYQNKGQNQTFSINHSPAVSALADTTFTTGIPSSGYSNYSPGFATGTGKINFPQTLGALTFDTFGHVKQVTKRTLTYGLNSPLTPINSSTQPYVAGGGSGFDLNVPTEADFNNLTKRVLTLQGNRVLVPTTGNIQLERDTDVTGTLGGSGTLNVNGNLNVGTIATPSANILKVDTSLQRVGINMGTSAPDRELNVKGKVKIDAGNANSMAGTIDNGYLVISSDSQTLGIDPNQIRTSDDLILQAPENNKSIQLETAAGEVLRVTSGGKVGIGTNNPFEKLHVEGNLVVGRNSPATNDTPHAIIFGSTFQDPTTSTNAHTAIATRLYGGTEKSELLLFKGNDPAHISGPDRIRHRAAEHVFQTYESGEKFFDGNGIGSTRYAVNDDNTRMVITNGGRIGIGTTSPTAKLHVSAPFTGDANLRPSNPNTADNSPSARFDTTVICEGNLVVKGDFNLQNGITFDNWSLAETSGNVTAGGTQTFTNSTNSSSKTTGAVKIAGGLGVEKNITTSSLVATSGSGGIQIDVADGGAQPALTAIMNIKGYEGRGAGISIQDSVNSASNPSNREWFIGSGYSQNVFNIGYAANGVNSSYSAQNKFTIGTTGNVNATGNITAQGNLVGAGATLSGTLGVTGAATLSSNLTVNGNTTLGNAASDSLTISGDLLAGNNGASERNKLFFESSTSRLGIGETSPTAHFSTGTKVDISSVDAGVSELILRGSAQGSGRLFVGQSNDFGGGIHYNGDNNPAMVGDADRIVHFRRSTVSGTTSDEAVFQYSQQLGQPVDFKMGINMSGSTTTRRNITGVNRLEVDELVCAGSQPVEISDNLTVFGADFDLNNTSRRTKTSATDPSPAEPSADTDRRALVHEFGDRLSINYSDDYTGGLKIGDHFQFNTDGTAGIGELAPLATLHVKDSSEAKVAIQTTGTSDAVLQLTNANLALGGTSGNNSGWTMRLDNSIADGLNYRWNNSTKMHLTTTGNLGIGSAIPSVKLDVAGVIATRTTVPQIQFHDTTAGQVNPTRLRMDSGSFSIRRATAGNGTFDTDIRSFEHSANGNVAIGESILPNNQMYMHFINKATASDSYIHTRNELFFMGQANTFIFDGRSRDASASFAVTDSGTDIIPFNDSDINYQSRTAVGDGNTRIGIVLRRDAGNFLEDGVTVNPNASRGGLIYGSRDRGGSLLLNRNTTGGEQIYFNNDGSRTATIHTGKPGANNFEIFTRTEDSTSLKRRIAVYKNGSILNLSQTYIHDESSDIDGDPSAVLHLRSHSSDHIRFESGTNAHLATIDMDESNGLYIECNTSTTSAKKIRLRPDNADRLTLTSSACTIVPYLNVTSTKDALDNDSFAAINTEGGLQVKKKSDLRGDTQVGGTLSVSKTMKGTISTIDINDGTQVNIDLSLANTFVINVRHNNTLVETINESANAGAYYTFIIKNEGNHDINFGASFYFVGGEPQITSGNGKIDLMSFVCDGTNLYGGISPNLIPANGV